MKINIINRDKNKEYKIQTQILSLNTFINQINTLIYVSNQLPKSTLIWVDSVYTNEVTRL